MVENRVYFGFERVSPQEKAQRVGRVFERVSRRYDLMNDLLSAGRHRVWKSRAVSVLNPQPSQILLDVAGGTGDVARLWLERAARVRRRRGSGKEARAVVMDINLSMLCQAADVVSVCGDGQALPVADSSVDAVSTSFGLRNIADMDLALREFHRVLKPGGCFVCLEFSHVSSTVLRKFYDACSFTIIPALGRVVTGDGSSYRYLVESIRTFPSRSELARRMSVAGFERVRYRCFAAGAVALHSGWRAG